MTKRRPIRYTYEWSADLVHRKAVDKSACMQHTLTILTEMWGATTRRADKQPAPKHHKLIALFPASYSLVRANRIAT